MMLVRESLTDTSANPKVWADGYGRWHASVPLTGSRNRDGMVARQMIRAELEARGERVDTVRVTRERVTAHGTAVYGEA